MMNQKRAATGFRGLALAPVTTNTLTAYASSTAAELPYAGSLSRTQKTSSTDLYYDDDLYAQVRGRGNSRGRGAAFPHGRAGAGHL